MRVVVTGACSNLASAILPRLIARPDVESVIGLDIRAPSDPIEGVEYRQADVTDPAIAEHLAGAGAVFHLAFIVMGGEEDIPRAERVNIDGSRNVFDAAIDAGVEHITYASSIASYGAHPDNAGVTLTEESPLRGGENDLVYPRTKAEVERMLDAIEARGPTPPIARIRPSAFLGGSGRASKLMAGGFFPVLVGIPDYPAHLSHQDDIADVFVRAFVRRASGGFNAATAEPLPSSQWPALLGKRALPVPAKVLFALLERFDSRGPADLGLLKLSAAGPIVVSADKARRELGWRPRFPTTADVLRELGNQATHRARLQTRLIMGGLVALTRLRGGLPLPRDRRRDLDSFAGAIDLIYTGHSPSSWHLSVGDGAVRFGRGRAPRARASVRLDESVLFDMLSGRLDTTTATMTGQLRYSGDAGMSMVVGGFFTQLGKTLRAELPELIQRWLLK